MSHTFKYLMVEGTPNKHFARCSCRFRTKDYLAAHLVGDEVVRHQNAVERLRLQLGTRTPSLKNQRDYYDEMAANENLPQNERDLWQQLADELTTRLNDRNPTDGEQPPLF